MPPLILPWSLLDGCLAGMLAALPAIRFRRAQSAADLAEALPEADGLVMLGHLYTAGTARLCRRDGLAAALDTTHDRRLWRHHL
jgi:hypothetical protein